MVIGLYNSNSQQLKFYDDICSLRHDEFAEARSLSLAQRREKCFKNLQQDNTYRIARRSLLAAKHGGYLIMRYPLPTEG